MGSIRPFQGKSKTTLETRESSRSVEEIENYDVEIVQIIDVEKEYELLKKKGLRILEPTYIYNTKIFENKNRFIKYISEVKLECLGEDTVTLELLGKHKTDKLRKLGYKFCHLGLITVAIKGLRRKGLGTKALTVIYDSSWTNMEKAMIASTKIDMNKNLGIAYCMPDFMMTLTDLRNSLLHARLYDDT